MPLPHLGTMNGSGTRLLGVRPCGDGTFHATAWKVWSNMPIRPLSRHRLRMLGARQNNLGTLLRRERSIELLEDTPLEPREVRSTRLQHWLVAPLVLLLPLLLCLPLWSWIGSIAVGMGKKASQGQAAAFVIGLLWLSVGSQVWVTLRDRRLDQQGPSD